MTGLVGTAVGLGGFYFAPPLGLANAWHGRAADGLSLFDGLAPGVLAGTAAGPA